MAVSSSVVSVGTTATKLSPDPTDNQAGSSVAVNNTGAATVYLGGSGVTTSAGFPLAAGGQIAVDLGGESLYGIVTTGTVSVTVLATGV